MKALMLDNDTETADLALVLAQNGIPVTLFEYAPKQTCRNVFPKDGILPNHPETMFRCSECGCDVQDCESYAISMVGGSWNYCPNCGAKVVE